MNLLSGAEVEQVGEQDFHSRTVLTIELEVYPEPKILNQNQLKDLYMRLKSYADVGRLIGASSDFVSQNIRGLK